MRIGSLFSGAGALDMAVQTVFGGEVVWHCEVDPAASKVLACRYPDVPNYHDITEFDWERIAETKSVQPVDVLCGGYPCQPFSAAGQRKGETDERHLWPYFAEAIRRMRPGYVVLENVAGHRSMGFGSVLADLASMRYDAQWCSLRAADVGAPHGRERLFVVAHPEHGTGNRERSRPQFGEGSAVTTDTDKRRRRGGRETSRGDVGRHDEINGRGRREPAAGRSGSHPTPEVSAAVWPESAGLVGGSDAPVSGDGPDGGITLLPTPTSADFGRGSVHPDRRKQLNPKHSPELHELARHGLLGGDGPVELLPTPTAQSAKHDADDRGFGTLDDHNLWSVAARIGRGELLPTPRATRGGSNTETVELLPTPVAHDGKGSGPSGYARAAADGNRGQDFARANREGSGGDDLVTLVVKATNASQWGKYAPAIERWEQVTRPAPAPTEPNKNGNPRLSAAFSEWMMGWPEGWVTQVPGISRNDQLRIIGNGVCPQQCAAALRYLLSVAEVAA